MSKSDNLSDFLKDIANAIRTRKKINYTINPQEFSNEILSIQNTSNISDISEINEVQYRDYNGNILYRYSIDEFLQLTNHPNLPYNNNLICQEWNYSLEDAKKMASQYNKCYIGATYITDNGDTKIYLNITSLDAANIPLCFTQSTQSGVIINWGDGTNTQTVNNTGNITVSHQYTSIGEYCISLKPINDCVLGLGHNNSTHCVLGSLENSNRKYRKTLYKIEIGKNVELIGTRTFSHCSNLKTITMPNTIKLINTYAFYMCNSLISSIIPNSVETLARCAFSYCSSMIYTSIPISVTSIAGYMFQNCYDLQYVIVPDSVTVLGESSFYMCPKLIYIKLSNNITELHSNVFYNCHLLPNIDLPENITIINDSAFRVCYELEYLKMPKKLQAIEDNAFYACIGMMVYDFSDVEQIPTLASTAVFGNISSDCKIVVPDKLYNSWKTATNWNGFASKIIKSSEYNN